eukprot:CAMPEP_0196583368 /NCGR_PEP_ID=MMETSP1081-20130531/43262_1 /TAXON_ID=36882 /ORGANISM="Pyramimonas amylifera, Strain CCMP720" /LENGTH=530 /DNA_ID=CAMNT_0041904235 /DNA_START=372 /DNA_END=1964 /DNA_ORIENTATION=+
MTGQKDPMASTMFPSIDTTIHQRLNKDWQDKSFQLSQTTKTQNLAANRVRVTSSIVREVVTNNDSHHFSKVNMGFRVKMGQTSELVRKLELGIRSNSHQAAHLNTAKQAMLKAKQALSEPQAVCKRRIRLRESKPMNENIEDTAYSALEQELNGVTSMMDQLRNKTAASQEMMDRMHTVREKMRHDLRDKRHALNLDGSCLLLSAESANQHPPQEQTLHSKVTTLAGEVPPALPTAVLLGENAVGRFSYEWLFSKEEREQLKESFKQFASYEGEILAANFQMVYTSAGLQVSEKDTLSVLDVMNLHPDTQLTWPKFCEVLASMRAHRDPVVLPHQWRAKTADLLECNEAVIMAAKWLVAQAYELSTASDEVRKKTNAIVMKCLRRKIQEALELRDLAEKRLQETAVSIYKLEQSERDLVAAFESRARPLAVSEARYNIRRQRKEGEEVHDEVEDLIAREVEELQKGVAAIQRELDSNRAQLGEMIENRKVLEADIDDKNATIEMDQKCLKLEDRASAKKSHYNAFLQGHI